MITHLQTRAYPLQHREVRAARAEGLVVTPHALTARPGTLHDLAYGHQETIEVDLTTAYPRTTLPEGIGVHWARLRVLGSGIALCTVALRHTEDLGAHEVAALDGFDADLNRLLKPAELALVDEVLRELVEVGAVLDPRPHVTAPGSRSTTVHAEAVRYNCHVVCASHPWTSNGRVLSTAEDLDGTTMRPLLPYTYAWEAPADATQDEVLALIEPADVVVAQRSVLAAAQGDSLQILDRLVEGRSELVEPAELRRHLDRLRLSYHRLDSYRYDSAQTARSAYLAARREIGLDDVHTRTEGLLAAATQSLVAEADAAGAAFDARLNRTASVLTVATAGLFTLELILFARDGAAPPAPWRHYAIALVLLGAAGALTWLYAGLVRRRRA